MAEYIEREALMRRIKEIHCAECDSYHGVRCRACWVDDTLDYIDSEPSVDVALGRYGRWELHYEVINGELIPSDKKHVCSECKDIWETSSKLNYCPNCGAKMDGGSANG